MRILVSGGLGFIGSAVVRRLARETAHEVLILDKLTYAASEEALEDAVTNARVALVRADITDAALVRRAFGEFLPNRVLHLAAETHVDRSIDCPGAFVRTNISGTYTMLDAARAYWAGLTPVAQARFRFVHVSTDEVFGSLAPTDPPATAASPYAPRSPYAASKAAADHLVRAWFHTYGLPTLVTHATNTYGPWQFPEKLIPRVILAALEGRDLPVYGDGSNQRDWLYVADHAAALLAVLERGEPGATYGIAARARHTNLEVVATLARMLDELAPDPRGSHARRITFVADRPGHDRRYALDPSAAERALGWHAAADFETGLRHTLAWYLAHRAWIARARCRYGGERLGSAA